MLNVVLIEPEIPQNTGSIGRLCLAVGATLHLVEPLGFEITDTRLRRAGLDYWEHLKVIRHSSIKRFFEVLPPVAPKVFFSKKVERLYYEHVYLPGTYLIFGKETAGLSDEILQEFASESVKIPIFDPRVRSLNLANAVSIGVYEAVRQLSTSISPNFVV